MKLKDKYSNIDSIFNTGDGRLNINKIVRKFGEIHSGSISIEFFTNNIDIEYCHYNCLHQKWWQKILFFIYKWINKDFYKKTGAMKQEWGEKHVDINEDDINKIIKALKKINIDE